MLDARFVRENLELVETAMRNRNHEWDSARFTELDEARRAAITEQEALQAERNAKSKEIGKLMGQGKKDEAEAAKEQVRLVNEKLEALTAQREAAEGELHRILMTTPNIPHETTPVGKDETENPEVRRWGTPRDFEAEGMEMKPHWDLGADLNIIDAERAIKLSGSRFVLLGGMGARLERALMNFMVDSHAAHGFKEWWTPYLVNKQTMTGTGQLPKFEEDLFKTKDESLYLIPTAEVPLTNIHAGDVLDAKDLPLYYTAFTPCFREEAGSAGRDTRGIIRVHQFDKVEMVKFATPETSHDELESLTNEAEYILQQPQAPVPRDQPVHRRPGLFRCQDLRRGSLMPSWLTPTRKSVLQLLRRFQARRANIKYRDPDNFKGTRYVHTLNGSGLAIGRCMAALMENYQNADGTITVPDVLVPYMGGVKVIEPQK